MFIGKIFHSRIPKIQIFHRQNIPVVATIVTIQLKSRTPKAVKSQAIADLLAQFLGEEEFPLDDEDPGEVAMAEEVREQ